MAHCPADCRTTRDLHCDYAGVPKERLPKTQRWRILETIGGGRTLFVLDGKLIYELESSSGEVRVIGNFARNCRAEVRNVFGDRLKHAGDSVGGNVISHHFCSSVGVPQTVPGKEALAEYVTKSVPFECLVTADGEADGEGSLTAQDVEDAVAQGLVREEPDWMARSSERGKIGNRMQPVEAKQLGGRIGNHMQPVEAKQLGGRNQPVEAKQLGGHNQPVEAKQKGGRNCIRQRFLQKNGYVGEAAFKMCQDAHQKVSDMVRLHKRMTKCPAAGCEFKSTRDSLVRHVKQVLAMKDTV